jgi:hypothetical protein
MKKIAGISILIFAGIVFIFSSVRELTNSFFELRRKPSSLQQWWGSDKGGTGDLYGFTCLPQFAVGDTSVLRKPTCNDAQKTYNIYAQTDSYTEEIFTHPDYFCGAAKCVYAFTNTGDVLPVYLDKTKKNIVMIECVERNIRKNFIDTNYLTRFIKISTEKINDTKAAEKAHNFHFHFDIKNLDGNYETNIWDYLFLRPIKQLKAKMTFDLFNRTYVDALVSPDGKYLLYQPTVDTAFLESSYKPIADKELKKMVTALNVAYDHFRRLGFDEVYLSIIPNPGSILYPNYKRLQYNQLIPRLENDPSLKLKVFDIYQVFKNSPEKDKLYQRSDTHWTRFGAMVWLNEFNRQMAETNNTK